LKKKVYSKGWKNLGMNKWNGEKEEDEEEFGELHKRKLLPESLLPRFNFRIVVQVLLSSLVLESARGYILL